MFLQMNSSFFCKYDFFFLVLVLYDNILCTIVLLILLFYPILIQNIPIFVYAFFVCVARRGPTISLCNPALYIMTMELNLEPLQSVQHTTLYA